jgi:multiple sugar transport system substrate-binding protein/putative aldouronate transport system substrate-binding protein
LVEKHYYFQNIFREESLEMKKKALSVLLASAMVVSLAACGSSSDSSSDSSSSNSSDSTATSSSSSSSDTSAASTDTTEAEPYNLTEINCVVNGTLTATEDNGQAEFIEQWEAAVSEKLGHDIKLNITQFDHSGYTDAVGRLMVSDDLPDVMIMSADMFKQYAPTGILWDMADAYDNAEFQSRLNLTAINESLKDSEGHLYGFAPAYGNGCVTYVKQTWLDNVGLSIDDIKTFDDYYDMLLKFHNEDPDGNGVDGDTYGVIAAGYIGTEAPWINYLPEFWQDAYPSLVQDDDGTWIDGFQTDATKAAIERIKKGADEGAIDPDTLTASTKIAREKFFSNEQSGSEGVFTYWAGSWYQTLTDNLIKNGVETDLVQLPAIAEVGSYLNREAPVWVIIDDQDGDDSREQAIFDAFIDTMLDGDTVQTLWTYGAEDVHWSTHAEEFTTNPGTENAKDYSYEEGEFHLKQSPNDSNSVWKKNAMDPALVVSPLTNGYNDISELAVEGNEFFTENCIDAPVSPSCETWTEYSGEIISARGEAISKVVSGQLTVDEAMDEYVKAVGEYVDQALSELNAQ